MLGERVGLQRLIAIGIGLAGVLIITRPGLGIMHPAAVLTLLGTIGYSFFGILTPRASPPTIPRPPPHSIPASWESSG